MLMSIPANQWIGTVRGRKGLVANREEGARGSVFTCTAFYGQLIWRWPCAFLHLELVLVEKVDVLVNSRCTMGMECRLFESLVIRADQPDLTCNQRCEC